MSRINEPQPEKRAQKTLKKNNAYTRGDGKLTFDELPNNVKIWFNEYLVDFNGSQAAIRMGEKHPELKTKYPKDFAYRWLQHPAIQDELGRVLALRFAENEVTVQRVLDELASIGFVELTRDEKVNKAGHKLKALELLGRHLGMFTDKLDVSVQKSFEQQLDELFGSNYEFGKQGEDEPGELGGDYIEE